MTPDQAARVIEATIAARWAVGPNTPIAWPNLVFTPPATGPWLKVDLVWGNGAITTKELHRVTGLVQLTVFGPKGAGDGAFYAMVESARSLFNRQRLPSPNRELMFGATSGPVAIFDESWRALAVSAPFTCQDYVPAPPPISGLRLWLDGESFAAVPDATAVARWTDLSGCGNHCLQATAFNQPITKRGLLAGQSAVRFDGTNTYLDCDPLTQAVPIAHSIAVVAFFGGTGGTICNPFIGPPTALGEALFYSSGNLAIVTTQSPSSGNADFGAIVSFNAWHYLLMTIPAAGYCRLFADGTELVPNFTDGTMRSFALTRFRLGMTYALGNPLQGDVAAVLVFDHELTDPERAILDTYMLARYGL